MMEYHPFVIRIEELEGDTYRVIADCQGATRFGKIPANLPLLDDQEIQKAQRWLRRGLIDREYAKDFGNRLFQTLFPAPIRELFREAFARVAPQNGLRIVLTQPLPAALASLPWELAYDEQGGHGFLARSTSAPLVRHYNDMPLSNPLPEEGPLRVLIVTASPKNKPPLSTKREAEKIIRSIEKGGNVREILRTIGKHLQHKGPLPDLVQRLRQRRQIQVSALHHATQTKLRTCLIKANDAEQGFHVVHFIGHGEANENSATLLLEDNNGDTDAVPADEFAEMIYGPTVNLVVLNACETASTVNLFQNVAQEILRRRVPAVIGMQAPILDRAAADFAHEFYGVWASGVPIESALAHARRRIRQESPGAAADWSIPVLYMTPLKGLTPKISVPPPRRLWRWLAASWAIVTFISVVLGLVVDVRQLPDFRSKDKMQGEFIVAVAQFVAVDQDGKSIKSATAEGLADRLYDRLDLALKDRIQSSLDLEPSPLYEVWPPDRTGKVEGKTDKDRMSEAAKLVDKISGDKIPTVIVYGVITETAQTNHWPELTPEFYVSSLGFEQGQEIIGQHQLGAPLKLNPHAGWENSEPLRQRMEALTLITVGLSEYSRGEFQEALVLFSEAERFLEDKEGKEVIYLLLGNTNLYQVSEIQNEEYLNIAFSYYSKALAINPSYARALVGQAAVLYRMALGDLDEPDPQDIKYDQLKEAETRYEKARNLSNQLDNTAIEARAHFGLGQINLARAQFLEAGENYYAPAQIEFEQVIHEYEKGKDKSIRHLAGDAHASLGLIADLRGDLDAAIEHYEVAIELVNEYSKSKYYLQLAGLLALDGQNERARKAYKECIMLAENYNNEDDKKRCDEQLKELFGKGDGNAQFSY